MTERWWITTDTFAQGGEAVLGPFESLDLALAVRSYVEKVPQHLRRTRAARQQETFWVDKETDHG